MNTNYEQLTQFLRKNCEEGLNNIDFYVGEINGKYDTEYNIDKKEILDTILSDGKVFGDTGSYEVDDASYVCIARYKNKDKKLSSEIEKIYLFMQKEDQRDFMFYLVQEDIDIYQKLFDQGNYKGNISKYKKDEGKGLKIFPSSELIEYNKELLSKEGMQR